MSTYTMFRAGAVLTVALGTSGWRAGASHAASAEPETVLATYHAKRGAEDELARVIADHWNTAKRLNLVILEPHILVRSAESGVPVEFTEILTWRDANTPDSAPPEIRALWDRMNALVDSRGAHPGIEFTEVKVLQR
jgi:hypothetical protein